MKLKKGVLISEYNGGHIVVAAGDAGKIFNGMIKINKSAAFIIELLKNETDIEKLTTALCEKYEVDRKTAMENVITTVETIRKTGLLEE